MGESFVHTSKTKSDTAAYRTEDETEEIAERETLDFEPLLPPFMQAKVRRSVVKGTGRVSKEIDIGGPVYLGGKTRSNPPGDNDETFPVCANVLEYGEREDSILDQPEKIVNNSCAPCELDCKISDTNCKAWLESYEERGSDEVTDGERYDVLTPVNFSDYEQLEEGYEMSETSRREWWDFRKEDMWSLDRCESVQSMTGDEGTDENYSNIVDPHLSHELFIPFRCMPRPRFFAGASRDAEYVGVSLPRRPRSPIRHFPSEKFDLTEERRKRLVTNEDGRCLKESKDRIARTLRKTSEVYDDEVTITSSLVLLAVCEEVILSFDTNFNSNFEDVHNFVNFAVVWALLETNICKAEMLSEEQLEMSRKWGVFEQEGKFQVSESIEVPKFQGISRVEYCPRVRPYGYVHRYLPWHLVSPSHERGNSRFYPNVRERIDEKLPDTPDQVRSAYVPDLTCFHLREVPDKAYVAYRRRTRSLSMSKKQQPGKIEELLTQLVSFM